MTVKIRKWDDLLKEFGTHGSENVIDSTVKFNK
jgi:hypothetical protein